MKIISDRNLQIYGDRMHGMSYKEISFKYGISYSRARKIFVMVEERLKRFYYRNVLLRTIELLDNLS